MVSSDNASGDAIAEIADSGHRHGLALVAAAMMHDDLARAFAAQQLRVARARVRRARDVNPRIPPRAIDAALALLEPFDLVLEDAPWLLYCRDWARLLRWLRVRASGPHRGSRGSRSPHLFEIDAGGMDLEPLVLAGLFIADCRFESTAMVHSVFDTAVLERCDFSRARLARTSWRGATLIRCTLAGAAMADACLDGATFIECDLRGADLSASEVTGSARRAVFVDSDLRDTGWEARVIADARFAGCRMAGIHGRPIIDGALIERPDLSPLDDARSIDRPADVLRLWRRESPAR